MKKVYVSDKAGLALIEFLKTKREVLPVGNIPAVDAAIASHPDILYCRLSSGADSGIYRGDAALLGDSYPSDCIYNAACVGKYIIASQAVSQELVEQSGLDYIPVKQGYTKCNLVVVDDRHVITEDEGIARTLAEKTDLECLLVHPREVVLSGYANGFIGGASGRIDDEILFNGDLSVHSDHEKIKSFIEGCGLRIRYFKDYPLTDIGSIVSE